MKKKYFALIIILLSESISFSQPAWKDLFVGAQNQIKAGDIKSAQKSAEAALEKAIADYKKESEYYAATLSLYGEILFRKGDYTKSANAFGDEIKIRKALKGKETTGYAKALHNLSTVLVKQGKFGDAEPIMIEAINIKLKAGSPKDSSLALSYQNLGVVFQMTGKFSESENAYLKASKIRKEVFGTASLPHATSEQSLGTLYMMLGNYDNAVVNLENAVNVFRSILGDENLTTANAAFILAKCYLETGKKDKAKPLINLSMSVQKNDKIAKNPEYIQTLISLGQARWANGDYDEALKVYENAKSVIERYYGNGHPDFINCVYSIGTIEFQQGKFDLAYKDLFLSIKMTEQIFHKSYPEYATRLHTFAGLLQNMGKFKEADAYYKKAFNAYTEQIKKYFPFLSESEKAKYYFNLKKRFDMYNCYVISNYKEHPELISEMLNNRIATKAILLNNNLKIKNKIQSSDDEKTNAIYKKWKDTREELTSLYHLSNKELAASGKNIDSLESECNSLEKQMSSVSEDFRNEIIARNTSWKDVADALDENETAVEIIRFNFNDKAMSDSVYYVALIINKNTKDNPEIVVMKNGNQMESKYIKAYHNAIRFKIPDNESYKIFWKAINDKIDGQNIVYVSPDGIYNKLNISTLENLSGEFVIEKKNIILVTNLNDIYLNKKKKSEKLSKSAFLLGNPTFRLQKAAQNNLPDTIQVQRQISESIRKSDIKIQELPGTKLEIENINSELINAGWASKLYTEELASEDNLNSIRTAGLIHIATHGFFLNDVADNEDNKILGINSEKAKENPFLRSGLLLAGAESAVLNETSDRTKGILTSYEVSGYDFDKINLLVLSACETGLGEVKNGEGVYGLQRAFQIAGAKTIIMSLWKVDDEATQTLMADFYKQWLSGKKMHEAFKDAQLNLKQQNPHPYFWGGFIIIGEFD